MSGWVTEISYVMLLPKLLQGPELYLEKQPTLPVVVYSAPGNQDTAYFSSHFLAHITLYQFLFFDHTKQKLICLLMWKLYILYTNLSSWTSQNADLWLKRNQLQAAYNHVMSFEMCFWQQRFISCFKTKKAQYDPSLPWKCWFLMYKMNRWSPKGFSESTIQIHFWRIIMLYLWLILGSMELRDNKIIQWVNYTGHFFLVDRGNHSALHLTSQL